MNSNEIIAVPFLETLRRSFLYVVLNFDSFCKLISFWLLLLLVFQLFTGPAVLCSFGPSDCRAPTEMLSLTVMSIFSLFISAAYYRLVILRQEVNWLHPSLQRKDAHYIAAAAGIALIYFFSLAAILLVAFGLQSAGVLLTGKEISNRFILIFTLIPSAAMIFFYSRFYLVLPAAAVGNGSLGLMDSFRLARGNTNKIFWGSLIICLPGILLYILCGAVYGLLRPENEIARMAFAAVVILINFIDVSFKASFYAHVYQYLTYFQKKQQTETAAAPAEVLKS